MENHGYTYRVTTGGDASGVSVEAFLARRYPHTSREGWLARVQAGEVLIDGVAAASGTPLAPGRVVSWNRPPWHEPEVPLSFAVLHEDADVLAVDKPSGLPTLPAGGFLEHTLLALVRRRWPDAAPLHRLGRGTSGVLLFACTERARRALNADFREGRVVKRYRALAAGQVMGPLTIDTRIGPVHHELLGTVHGASATGRTAVSHVSVVERRAQTTLVDVRIETGRPHQIRIHLAAAGHPLAGDPLYGPGGLPLPGVRALPGDGGYLLHAREIAFAHPATLQELTIAAPVPEALLP